MSGLDTRYQFSVFSLFDYRGVEENLTAMAAKGWMIEGIGGFLWKFKKTEPSNKKFAVFFPQNASEYVPTPILSQRLLEELCTEGGWEKVVEWRQMQIFCADQEAPPMETDEAVRLESVHSSMKKTFLPSLIIAFFGMLIAFFGMLIAAFFNGMRYFGDSPYRDEGTVWVMLLTLYVALIAGGGLLGYLFWLTASRKKISEGGTCASAVWHRRLMNMLSIGFIAAFVCFFADTKRQLGGGLIFYIIIYMAAALSAVSIVSFLTRHLKERGWSPFANKILSGAVTVILIIGMIVITNIIEAILR